MLGAPGMFDAGQVADALIGGLVEILLGLLGSKLFQLVAWTVGGFLGSLLVYWFAVSFRSLVYLRRKRARAAAAPGEEQRHRSPGGGDVAALGRSY